MVNSFHFKVRRLHRYLGVFLGIQFLFWTMGGLYFSWSDMDEVHGEHQKAHVHAISGDLNWVSPQLVIDKIKLKNRVNFIFDLRVVQILGKPFYQIAYSEKSTGHKIIQLGNAQTGELRSALRQNEAVEIAKMSSSERAKVKRVEYVTTTDGHHEYRGQPLPAFAVTFESPSNTTIYVASELGTVQKFRNNQWRVFDFLWMMHTMDYKGRDNLSNWLLRIFSIAGLLTILSGFILFWVSQKRSRLE